MTGRPVEESPLYSRRAQSPVYARTTTSDRVKAGARVAMAAVWLAISALLACAGYFALFASFAGYDDEGSWLIGLRNYHIHGSLYHNTYAQAGPFFYEVFSLAYSVLHVPIDWDTGRALTLVVWIATSLVVGIAIWVLTRRMLLGLLAETVAYLVMWLLAGVSMEPAGLAHLLGALVLLGIALLVRGYRRSGIAMAAVASSALVGTKVNIGLFVVAGLAAAMLICWPSQRWVGTRRAIAVLGLAALPVVLMEQVLGQPWARNYCVLELVYLAGLIGVLLTMKLPAQAFDPGEIAVGLAFAIGAGALITLGVLVHGTSLSQLLEGAVLGQRGLVKGTHLSLPVAPADVVVAVFSSTVAFGVTVYSFRRARRPKWLYSVGSGYARFVIGIWILLTISLGFFPGWSPRGLVLAPTVAIPFPGHGFMLAAPFVWIALLGAGVRDDDTFSFARIAICLVAVLGCLEGFPEAGSQMLWASLSLVPVGILCITDGVSLIYRGEKAIQWAGGVLQVPLTSLASVVFLALLTVGNVGSALSHWRTLYYENQPLRLLGATSVRLPLVQDKALRTVTVFLKHNCSTYWSVPGYNSFYFLAGEQPPSGFTVTQEWWKAFNASTQARILRHLRATRRLCLVEAAYYTKSYYLGIAPATPLVHYLQRDFIPVKTVHGGAYGSYHILVRRAP